MKRLHAPWRTEYIQGKHPRGCFICAAFKSGIQNPKSKIQNRDPDAENLLLFRGRKSLVMLNRYPYNNGHLMIAPCRHIGDIEKLTPAETRELFVLLQRTVKLLQAEYAPEGFNVGMNLGKVAGAGLAGHLHIHVVPRWNGDTNVMPILAGTKVISEGLARTYERLSRAFRTSRERPRAKAAETPKSGLEA
jgi:ATP adenylyltransferase